MTAGQCRGLGRTCFSCCLILLFGVGLIGKSDGQVNYQKQQAEVQNLPQITAASSQPTDVLAASLETVLHQPEICCGRDSALYDSVQAADANSLADVARRMNGRHLMSDGRPIRVTAEFVSPPKVSAADLIDKATKQQAGLVQWNGHLYVLHGLEYLRTYDSSTNAATFAIHRFLLWDTRFSDARRNVVIDREKEDLSHLQGILFLPTQAQ